MLSSPRCTCHRCQLVPGEPLRANSSRGSSETLKHVHLATTRQPGFHRAGWGVGAEWGGGTGACFTGDCPAAPRVVALSPQSAPRGPPDSSGKQSAHKDTAEPHAPACCPNILHLLPLATQRCVSLQLLQLMREHLQCGMVDRLTPDYRTSSAARLLPLAWPAAAHAGNQHAESRQAAAAATTAAAAVTSPDATTGNGLDGGWASSGE